VLFGLERIGPVVGKRVVVLGQGCIGLLFTMTLRRMGAVQIITVDRIGHRLEASRSRGADLAVNALAEDPVEAVIQATGGQGADLVVEASGDPAALAQGLQMARMYGTVILFGIPEEKTVPFDYFTAITKQINLVGTVSATCEAPARPIRLAVDLKQQGAPDLSWLVTHRLPFAEAGRGYEMYATRSDQVLKVVLQV
jgi:threonine dehydrogenase-like Zn-dependent dehydrogenase